MKDFLPIVNLVPKFPYVLTQFSKNISTKVTALAMAHYLDLYHAAAASSLPFRQVTVGSFQTYNQTKQQVLVLQ